MVQHFKVSKNKNGEAIKNLNRLVGKKPLALSFRCVEHLQFEIILTTNSESQRVVKID